MAAPEGNAEARRSWIVPTCAAGLAVFSSIALAACLNPMPEELPSDRDTQATADAPSAGQETGAPGFSEMSGSGGASPGLPPDGVPTDSGGSSTDSAQPPTPQTPVPEAADAGTDAATPTGDSLTDTNP